MDIRIDYLSETCLIVYLGDAIDPALVQQLAALTHRIKREFSDSLIEVIPSYTSLLIEYHPLKISAAELTDWLKTEFNQSAHLAVGQSKKVVQLPVYYHPDVAPDLVMLADKKQLTIEQVIEIHSRTEYTVCAIGFAPGFAFLGSVDQRIACPRHAEPRLKVARGSVGIADQQTAVYPQETPGGWQIIGNCPISLFDVHSDPMMPFEVGDTVCFIPVTRERFLELGGEL